MDEPITPQPNDQMVDPAMGDEDLNAWLDSLGDQTVDLPALLSQPVRAQEGNDEPTEEPEEPGEPVSGDEPEEPGAPAPVEGVDYFTINGQQWPREEIERLYQFDQYMRQNPDAAQRVAAALPQPSGQPPVPAPTQTQTGASEPDSFVEPTPPEGLDLEDPQTKFMWDSMVNLQKSQWEMTQQITREREARAQEAQRNQADQARRDMDTALHNFRQQFPGLNDEDITSIRQDAVPLVQGYMQQLPPVDALYRSMEVAAYANSDMRQKLEMSAPAPDKSTTRKRKLGSVAGTPRSAPRIDTSRPTFQSDKDMVNALAQGISDQLTGR